MIKVLADMDNFVLTDEYIEANVSHEYPLAEEKKHNLRYSALPCPCHPRYEMEENGMLVVHNWLRGN